MFLVTNELIERMLVQAQTSSPNSVKLHAVLSPDMKVIPISTKELTIQYTPKLVLSGDTDARTYRYNQYGTHNVTLENGGINVYYNYIRESNEHSECI